MIELTRTKRSEKVLFKFLNVIHALNLKEPSGLLHTKYNPPAGGIRESTYGFPNILR